MPYSLASITLMLTFFFFFTQARAEALRKQVKEEIHSRTVIQARIQSDQSDLIKSQAETKAKKEKVK